MKWHTEQRKISDLIPTEHNPRQLTEKQFKDLKKSVEKFDLAEIPAINTDNQILAGHQRLKIMAALGRGAEVIDVRVPDRKLTKKECDEYLVRSNKNSGEWNMDALANCFEVEDLRDWGFEDFELGLGIDRPTGDNSGASPWDRVADAHDGIMFSFGDIQKRLPMELYEAFSLNVSVKNIEEWMRENINN